MHHLDDTCTALAGIELGEFILTCWLVPYAVYKTKVYFQNCGYNNGYQLTDAAVITMANNCPELVSVGFGGPDCEHTDQALVALAESCSKLTSVAYIESKLVTNEGVEMFAAKLPNLLKVSFHMCDGLSDEAADSLATHCRDLVAVNVEYCHLTSAAVFYFARCKSLVRVNFIYFISCKVEDTAGSIIVLVSVLTTPSSILSGDSFYADMHIFNEIS